MDKELDDIFNKSKDLVELVDRVCLYRQNHPQSPVSCMKIMERVRWVYETSDLEKDFSEYGRVASLKSPMPTCSGVDFEKSLSDVVLEEHVVQAKEAWPKLIRKYTAGCQYCK